MFDSMLEEQEIEDAAQEAGFLGENYLPEEVFGSEIALFDMDMEDRLSGLSGFEAMD